MNGQPEAVCEENLHHQAHLVLGKIFLRLRQNDKALRRYPLRKVRKYRLLLLPGWHDLVGKRDVSLQWKIAVKRPPGGMDSSSTFSPRFGGMNVPSSAGRIEATSKDM